MVFSRGARSPRQALSRPSGVVNFAEGNTHASGSEDPLCCRHWVMRFCVVEDKATVRFERSLLGDRACRGRSDARPRRDRRRYASTAERRSHRGACPRTGPSERSTARGREEPEGSLFGRQNPSGWSGDGGRSKQHLRNHCLSSVIHSKSAFFQTLIDLSLFSWSIHIIWSANRSWALFNRPFHR